MINKKIYLDYQATTPTDVAVVEAMLPYFYENFENPASSNHFSIDINAKVENTRSIISQTLNCLPTEIIFTSGATESINIAFKGLLDFFLTGYIVTLKTEHSAVINSCRYLERKGFSVSYLDVQENGIVDLQKLSNSINSDTKLVAIMHVNNEIGVIQPIEEIGKICLSKKVPFFVDAAQSYGKLLIDVKLSNISMLALSGHKIYGPKGIGALYINRTLFNKLVPLFHGGGQEYGLRSGTLNVPGIIGLKKATEIAFEQMQSEQNRILQLRNSLLNLLRQKIANIIINGDINKRVAGNLNLCFKNVSSEILVSKLDNIIVSSGSACNSFKNQGSHVLKAIGLSEELADSAIRISIGRYTTEEEILQVADKISFEVNNIRRISTF